MSNGKYQKIYCTMQLSFFSYDKKIEIPDSSILS